MEYLNEYGIICDRKADANELRQTRSQLQHIIPIIKVKIKLN